MDLCSGGIAQPHGKVWQAVSERAASRGFVACCVWQQGTSSTVLRIPWVIRASRDVVCNGVPLAEAAPMTDDDEEDNAARPVFPFTAIVGQEQMKLALLLNIIDPKIGGVMVMGDRGTGKSTAVRALTDLLPKIQVLLLLHPAPVSACTRSAVWTQVFRTAPPQQLWC